MAEVTTNPVDVNGRGTFVVDMPEHAKLEAHSDDYRQGAENMLDFILDTKNYSLAHYSGRYMDHLVTVYVNRPDFMAEFFGVDPQRFSEEKDALLQAIRAANSEKDLEAQYMALEERGGDTHEGD